MEVWSYMQGKLAYLHRAVYLLPSLIWTHSRLQEAIVPLPQARDGALYINCIGRRVDFWTEITNFTPFSFDIERYRIQLVIASLEIVLEPDSLDEITPFSRKTILLKGKLDSEDARQVASADNTPYMDGNIKLRNKFLPSVTVPIHFQQLPISYLKHAHQS